LKHLAWSGKPRPRGDTQNIASNRLEIKITMMVERGVKLRSVDWAKVYGERKGRQRFPKKTKLILSNPDTDKAAMPALKRKEDGTGKNKSGTSSCR
jgi:hypothetical protein